MVSSRAGLGHHREALIVMTVLTSTGEEFASDTGRSCRAKDEAGRLVIVILSNDALEGFGQDAAWAAAERKYEAGHFQELDYPNRRRVRVEVRDIH